MKTIRLYVIVFCLFGIIGFQKILYAQGQKGNKTSLQNELLKQTEKDLLAGISKAICYSGFRSGQHPDRGNGAVNPDCDEVLEDMEILSYNNNFQLIRVYDSGVNSELVLRVIRENNINIKVMLGIWLRAEVSNHEGCPWLMEPIPDEVLRNNIKLNKQEIKRGISLANEFNDIVVAVNVGNEALVNWNDHMVETEKVISYVKKVKKNIDQPVTVADNYKWWAEEGKELAGIVDFISIHVYPVWEGKDIDQGMPYTIENVLEVRRALPDANIVIGEAGWATVASEFGARASQTKQKRYYEELMSWSAKMNITTFFFEAFDEDWKGDPANPLGAEKHWGIFTIDRKPKKVMEKLYPHL